MSIQGFIIRSLFAVLVVSGVVGAALAQASEPPPARPGSALFNYNEHMPSYWLMNRANRLYSIGRHYNAIHFYERASRYADKFGQYNVAVMHLKAEGTDFDPVRAWAWLELSAERGYPMMRQAADDLFGLLDGAQQRQAQAIYERELLPEYGDAVAIPRAQLRMDRDRRQSTGSRLGSPAMLGMLRVIDYQGDGLSRNGAEYYDPAKWDMQRLVEYETWQMENLSRGQVEMGDVEIVEDESDR
jgi:TPR repeat protein